MNDMYPRLMLAAPASGSGKTTLTIALLRAFEERGLCPAACKCGPDYIDPMFHRNVLGVPSQNLDLFFSSPETVRDIFCHNAAQAGISLIEGVMGYYDGIGASSKASSWELAETLECPTILVVQAKGAFLSLAAMINGFVGFRDKSWLCGIIVNNCSVSLYAKLKPMLESETGLHVYGYMPTLPDAKLESRHLGLMMPEEVESLRQKTELLAQQVEKSVDIPALLKAANTASPMKKRLLKTPKQVSIKAKIAVARDAAFCFYYQENLTLLESEGAELVFFSPLTDRQLPEGIGGLYIGGGYPELHAEALYKNQTMRTSIREALASGLPTVAECGGFLYLQSELCGANGISYPMVGALSGRAKKSGKLNHFGYVTLTASKDTLLCGKGEALPCHEFHYWDSDTHGDAFTARKPGTGESWPCVEAGSSLYAGFPHLYFRSNPEIAKRFVYAAMKRSTP